MKLFSLFLACLCFVCDTRAQSEIRGMVVTSDSVSLPYATVSLYKDSVAIKNVVCDSAGHFIVLADFDPTSAYARSYKLRAFFQNASSVPVLLGDSRGYVRLIIADSSKTLSDIIVTSYKSRLYRQADRLVFVPGRELLFKAAAFDVLRHVPLIRVDDRSDAISVVNKPSTVVYINNRKSALPKEMIGQMLRSMSAENIISIEIITNPGSEYAANIAGAIVNINLRRGLTEGWQGNLSLLSEQSRYNTSIFNGGVNYRKGNLAINLVPFVNRSFNYYHLQNTLSYNDGQSQEADVNQYRKYFVWGGGVNVDYDISGKSQVSAKYWRTDVRGKSNTYGRTYYFSGNIAKPDSIAVSPYRGDDTYLYNFGNLNYHYNIDSIGNNYIDVNFDFNRFSQKRIYDGSFVSLDPQNDSAIGELVYKNEFPQNFRNYSERIEWVQRLASSYRMVIGGQLSNTRVTNNLRYYNATSAGFTLDDRLSETYGYVEDYWAGYMSLSRNFKKGWSVNAGLRLENSKFTSTVQKAAINRDSIYSNLYPSLAVNYSPRPAHQFGFSTTRKIRRPDIEELFAGRQYRNTGYYSENNPFLLPSLYFNNEFSYVFRRKYAITIDYSRSKNSYAKFVIPVIENGDSAFLETLLNYGKMESVGIVVNASFTFFKGFWQLYVTPYFNYNRYAGTVTASKIGVTNNDFNLVIDNYFVLSKKRNWMGFLTFNYNGPRKDISSARINVMTSLDVELKKVIKHFAFFLIASDIYNGKSVSKSDAYSNLLLKRNYTYRVRSTRALQLKLSYGFGNAHLKGNRNRNTANQEIRSRTN